MTERHAISLRTTLAPWLRLLAQRRGRLSIGTLLMALTLVSAIGLLALSGWFITASALAGTALAAGAAISLNIYVPGGGIRLFALTRTVSRYVERLYNHDTVLRLLADLRARLFGVLAGLDEHRLSRRRASDWLHRLTADIDALDSLYLRLLAPPAVAVVAVITLSAFVSFWLPVAGLAIAVLLGVAIGWLTWGQSCLGMAASRRRMEDLEHFRGRLIEQWQGLAELEAYASLASHRQRLDDIEARLEADQRRLGRLSALGNAVSGVAVGTTLIVVLWLAAQAYTSGQLSGPVMVMMSLAVLAFNEALAPLAIAFTHLGSTCVAAMRLNELEAAVASTVTPSQTLTSDALPARLDNVTLRYPGALVPALSSVSLTVAAGERVALCGASGAGKSSVASLLAGQLRPTQGKVMLDDKPVQELVPKTLPQRVAVLTQRIDLFDDSLAANLRLADPVADETRLWHALAMVELSGWAAGLPNGLATRVGEGGRQLSGGQSRRLALARLMLRDPGLVILDEPFAGLDATTAARVASHLDGWLDGRTVVYLVHDLGEQVDPPGIDRRLMLREGRLAPLPAPLR
ncbi:thiol reductant ABC exporter subunit CydC [Halomonas korlensis]|uniref:ATP-binding cassette, subfamily C, CydC n=1 Tax=Halomonas korlensis TaxID=463301 RepID=A0A1I7F2N7_9GAMM|nr:thiol reductant ABC exporter subunit CydC [Halomonas korlensis]SFU30427.1 ATP-binding cassette, subfamily C, CydC [Halomonas korlensis]